MNKIQIPRRFKEALEKRFPSPSKLPVPRGDWIEIHQECPLCATFKTGPKACGDCPFKSDDYILGCVNFIYDMEDEINSNCNVGITRSCVTIRKDKVEEYHTFRVAARKRSEWV